MNDIEMNQAMAEACGWKWWKFARADGSFWTVLQQPGSERWASSPHFGGVIVSGPEGEQPDSTATPKFTKDLNICHQAFLQCIKPSRKLSLQYEHELWHQVRMDASVRSLDLFEATEATARQRTIAMLTVLGRYTKTTHRAKKSP